MLVETDFKANIKCEFSISVDKVFLCYTRQHFLPILDTSSGGGNIRPAKSKFLAL
jgi:hypothetical protein